MIKDWGRGWRAPAVEGDTPLVETGKARVVRVGMAEEEWGESERHGQVQPMAACIS